MTTAPDLVDRFSRDLDSLVQPEARIGIAVSGGPDSLALLLLAAAARPGRVQAATVDHGLRPESAAEAAMVAGVCRRLGVPHATLPIQSGHPPRSNLQAWARALRYKALEDWASENQLAAIATAHHADDQAETILMRLARGAGLGGLSGVQRRRAIADRSPILLIRPLLDWRRAHLAAIVDAAGLQPAIDPGNDDPTFDRTRARRLLAATPWLDAVRLSASASHLGDAEEALDWAAAAAIRTRATLTATQVNFAPAGLPRELKRRILGKLIAFFGCEPPPGPKLMAALDRLDAGATTTLAGLRLEGGSSWRISRAPPRRPVRPPVRDA